MVGETDAGQFLNRSLFQKAIIKLAEKRSNEHGDT
jgi:hypothetical protein